jgi:lipoate-protein ligase B
MTGRPANRPTAPLSVFDLGVAPYLPLQALQARLRSAVAEARAPGVILLLEHAPVITLEYRAFRLSPPNAADRLRCMLPVSL